MKAPPWLLSLGKTASLHRRDYSCMVRRIHVRICTVEESCRLISLQILSPMFIVFYKLHQLQRLMKLQLSFIFATCAYLHVKMVWHEQCVNINPCVRRKTYPWEATITVPKLPIDLTRITTFCQNFDWRTGFKNDIWSTVPIKNRPRQSGYNSLVAYASCD